MSTLSKMTDMGQSTTPTQPSIPRQDRYMSSNPCNCMDRWDGDYYAAHHGNIWLQVKVRARGLGCDLCGIMRSMHAGVKHFPLSLPQKVEIADFRSYTADIFG